MRVIVVATLVCVGFPGCLPVTGGNGAPPIPAAQNAQGRTVGLLTVLGEEARVAAFAAQSEALSAVAAGVPVAWQGGSAKGSVTPGPVHSVNARICRDVTHRAQKDRQRLHGRLTLCQNPDGTWEPLG